MWGDKYWEDWRGGVSGGAVLSPVEGLGAAPRKKINFALKIMQFWASFGTSFLYYRRKWGIIPPVLKVGDLSPCPPCSDAYVVMSTDNAPCGLRGCKNGPAPFPGRMSYKATKPGLVSVLYLSIHYMVSLFSRAPFYVLLVFIAMCAVFWLFWLSYQYLPSDWLERLVCVPFLLCFLGQLSHLPYSSWR